MLNDSVAERLSRAFELGPIRPPSEAYSLLIRATRNCPWNRCLFCPVYKGTKFELRPVEEIIRDIEAVEGISEGIMEMAGNTSCRSHLTEVAAMFSSRLQYGQCVHNVATWLSRGGKSAFLQDSNTLVMRTSDLTQVLIFLRHAFPTLTRVTTYGRSHTAARKPLTELEQLKDAGLDRIHIGLETGYDRLLSYMEKGCTATDHIEGGKRVKDAGISLCEYVMPGLGGRKMSQEHARETARVLNDIDPDYIRLRSLHASASIPLRARLQDGDFESQTEDDVVREIAVFIDNLQVTGHIKSDHVLNLLLDVEGKMPEDKGKCLDIISKYLSLPDEERLNFKVGRRSGLYSRLDDLGDSYKHGRVERAIGRLRANGTDIEEAMIKAKKSLI
jgi:hypothetical protein